MVRRREDPLGGGVEAFSAPDTKTETSLHLFEGLAKRWSQRHVRMVQMPGREFLAARDPRRQRHRLALPEKMLGPRVASGLGAREAPVQHLGFTAQGICQLRGKSSLKMPRLSL